MSDSTGNTGTPSTPGDHAAYYDLVTRLFAMHGGFRRYPRGAVPEILPGQLPPTTGRDLPQPAGARLVGSVIDGSVATIIYDTPQSAEEIGSAYLSALSAAGWREGQRGPHFLGGLSAGHRQRRPVGVESKPQWTGHAQVVRSDDDPILALETAPAPENGHTTIAVRVDDDRESPLRTMLFQRQVAGTPILPELTPPPNVSQLGGGGSAGSDHATSHGTVTALNLTLAQLAAHYTEQLRQAGWRLDASSAETQVAWSLWSLTRDGQPWRGFLVFVVLAEQPVLRAGIDLRADLVGDREQAGNGPGRTTFGSFSSGFSYAPLTRDGGTGVASMITTSGITLGSVTPAQPPEPPPTSQPQGTKQDTEKDTDQHAKPEGPDTPNE